MKEDKKIGVVIPAFNVENQIKATIDGIPAFVDFIIVIDDCGQDKTKEIVRGLKNDRVTLVENDSNRGVGGATKNGFQKGIELGADILVKVDGDDQMDTTKMENLIEPLFNGYNYSKANRFLHTNELRTMPKLRLLGNFFLTFLTKITSGYWNIFDPQNGFFAITKETLELLPLEKIHNRYFFENDMLINLNINRTEVCDVSIPAKYGDEKSSLRIWKICTTFPLLLLIRFIERIYKKYILYNFSVIGLFYITGLTLMLFGTLFGGYNWLKSFLTSITATTGTVMIAVLPIILGFQLALQAVVLEVQEGSDT